MPNDFEVALTNGVVITKNSVLKIEKNSARIKFSCGSLFFSASRSQILHIFPMAPAPPVGKNKYKTNARENLQNMIHVTRCRIYASTTRMFVVYFNKISLRRMGYGKSE